MRIPKPFLFAFILFALLSFATLRLLSQASSVRPLITGPIDQSKLTVLKGNVYPLARAEFDRGAAPASLAMDNMMLVLKRSAQQESALDLLLQQQQDRTSPNYHKWLTPQQFGQQYGPADQDIQTVTSWLQSQGFQNVKVSNGRTIIQFSGTAGEVQQAFHTTIHRYVLSNGQEHWANSTDPQIPTALTPVVVGVKQLHNFFPRPQHHSIGAFSRNRTTGEVKRLSASPAYTFAGGCQATTGSACYALGPYDFATIYNVLPLWNASTPINGMNETIAIVSDSDIVPSDVTNFTSLFGTTINFQQIQTDPSNDPGVQCPPGTTNPPPTCPVPTTSSNGDEEEAILDVQWAGSVAPGAQIDLVVSATPQNSATFGGDTSAEYIIDYNNNSTLAPILSYSYGACELGIGTTGNTFYDQLWQQAAGEGITVLTATGDNGSAGCDPENPDNSVDNPAQFGLAVSGEATTPYNIAVGGTDFNDFETAQAETYFSSTNSSGLLSAHGYIPETTYNDSCTNSIIYSTAFGFTTAEAACNNGTVSEDGLIYPAGGGGGPSNCTVSNGSSTSSCSGGYPKPSWQIGTGVPNDGKRDIPDVSLFSGDGTIQNFYVTCEADTGATCNVGSASTIGGVGGTSVATQAFAGLMALFDQKMGGRQGNVNPLFYTLAAGQNASACNSGTVGSTGSTCVFYDVTAGTNSMPCLRGSPDCTVNVASDSNGLLYANGVEAYNAGTGYDLATGLGSVNAANLASAWGPSWAVSSTSPTITISTAGGSGTMPVTINSADGFSGTVTFSSSACSGLPTGATCSVSPTSATLSSSTTAAAVTVTVNTTSSSAAPLFIQKLRTPWSLALLSCSLMACLLILTFWGSEWRLGRVATMLAFASLVTLAACGAGGSSTSSSNSSSNTGSTPVTTTATLTATSGSTSHAMNFTVTVQ